jgi:hypothetical protein
MRFTKNAAHTCDKLPSDTKIERLNMTWELTVRTTCGCCTGVTFAVLYHIKNCPYCGKSLEKNSVKKG